MSHLPYMLIQQLLLLFKQTNILLLLMYTPSEAGSALKSVLSSVYSLNNTDIFFFKIFTLKGIASFLLNVLSSNTRKGQNPDMYLIYLYNGLFYCGSFCCLKTPQLYLKYWGHVVISILQNALSLILPKKSRTLNKILMRTFLLPTPPMSH